MRRSVAGRLPAALAGALLVGAALFHLGAAAVGLAAPVLRPLHVGCMLVLVFLFWPPQRGGRENLAWWDVVCALAAVATTAFVLTEGDAFWSRPVPRPPEVFFGTALILLVLEACRRAAGWGLPIVAALALGLALTGPWTPGSDGAAAFDLPHLTALLYQSLNGVYGWAVEVSATLVVPFAIFGAFLEHYGIRKSLQRCAHAAAGGSERAPARGVVLWSLLRGGSAESGDSVSASVTEAGAGRLADAGCDRAAAHALLTACAAGAVIAPPVFGAAAFMIVGFLGTDLVDVLRMATIPAVLYACMLLWMVALGRPSDVSRDKVPRSALPGRTPCTWCHFVAPMALVIFLLLGLSPPHSVLLAIGMVLVLSLRSRASATHPARAMAALRDGMRRSLDVGAICAAAGIVAGIVDATGLALDVRAAVATWPGGLPLVAVCAGLAVAGMSVTMPVTAAYIVGATLVVPSLAEAGAPEAAAHMFVLYVAVLCGLPSRVMTSPVDAPRLRTMLRSWTYTLPALVLPAAFILAPGGRALLLDIPADTSWADVAGSVAATILALGTLAAAARNRLLRECTAVERALLIAGGLALAYPMTLTGGAGAVGLGTVLALQKFGPSRRS